jgi:hypothetical protein
MLAAKFDGYFDVMYERILAMGAAIQVAASNIHSALVGALGRGSGNNRRVSVPFDFRAHYRSRTGRCVSCEWLKAVREPGRTTRRNIRTTSGISRA